NGSLASKDLMVDGTVVHVRSTLHSNGDLEVELAGNPNRYQPDYGNFLPAASDTAIGANAGYVKFSIPLRAGVSIGTKISQQATVYFNDHAFGGEVTPTNVFESTVVPKARPLGGTALVMSGSPTKPSSRSLSLRMRGLRLGDLVDPTTHDMRLY